MRATCPVQFILLDLIYLIIVYELYNYGYFHFALFSNPLLISPSSIQISSSSLVVYVLLRSETKFNIHTRKQAYFFNSVHFSLEVRICEDNNS